MRLNWTSLSFVFANHCLQVFYKKSVLQNSKILHESTVTRAYLCCRHPRESAITKAPIVDVRLDSKYTSGKWKTELMVRHFLKVLWKSSNYFSQKWNCSLVAFAKLFVRLGFVCVRRILSYALSRPLQI